MVNLIDVCTKWVTISFGLILSKLYQPSEDFNFTYSADIPKNDVIMHISKFGWLVGHEVTCKDDGDFTVIRIKK